MGDLGLPGSVVEMTDAAPQKALWEVRKAGLNIMMSLKGDGKPVSFIEDCAVPLEHLADYTDRLTEVFARHGTRGTWYAHASVGTLHVRPILDMRRDGAAKMRAIAEEASAMVRKYKGAYSRRARRRPVRGEWIALAVRPAARRAPSGRSRTLLRPDGPARTRARSSTRRRWTTRRCSAFRRAIATLPLKTGARLVGVERAERSGHRGDHRRRAPAATPRSGFAKAVEMCNNNGHCRKFDAGTMCPSYRVTRDEQHLTRGRANTLRLALSGQLGAEPSPRDDGARGARPVRQLQGLQARLPDRRRHGAHEDRVPAPRGARRVRGFACAIACIADLPRWAPWARARAVAARTCAIASACCAASASAGSGFRRGARCRRGGATPSIGRADAGSRAATTPPAPTSCCSSTPSTAISSPRTRMPRVRVLQAAGYRVHVAARHADAASGRCAAAARYLAAGMVDEARARGAARCSPRLLPLAERGVAIVGLEPSCLLTLRDEMPGHGPGRRRGDGRRAGAAVRGVPRRAKQRAGRFALALNALPQTRSLLHGHCHQKAFGAVRRRCWRRCASSPAPRSS